MKKTYNVHGVELTSIQEMMFNKWCDNNGIAMNTLNKSDRKEKVELFLSILKNSPFAI